MSLPGTGNGQTTLKCEDLFQSYDANGDGTVTKEEFYTAWDSGVDPQKLSVLSLRDKSRYQSKKVSTFYDLDVNEDLKLTMQEFCASPDAVIEHESQK